MSTEVRNIHSTISHFGGQPGRHARCGAAGKLPRRFAVRDRSHQRETTSATHPISSKARLSATPPSPRRGGRLAWCRPRARRMFCSS